MIMVEWDLGIFLLKSFICGKLFSLLDLPRMFVFEIEMWYFLPDKFVLVGFKDKPPLVAPSNSILEGFLGSRLEDS